MAVKSEVRSGGSHREGPEAQRGARHVLEMCASVPFGRQGGQDTRAEIDTRDGCGGCGRPPFSFDTGAVRALPVQASASRYTVDKLHFCLADGTQNKIVVASATTRTSPHTV